MKKALVCAIVLLLLLLSSICFTACDPRKSMTADETNEYFSVIRSNLCDAEDGFWQNGTYKGNATKADFIDSIIFILENDGLFELSGTTIYKNQFDVLGWIDINISGENCGKLGLSEDIERARITISLNSSSEVILIELIKYYENREEVELFEL